MFPGVFVHVQDERTECDENRAPRITMQQGAVNQAFRINAATP
jgi:hypothetical protein